MSSSAWTTFRVIRIIVFALAALLCMTSTVIYTVFLLREQKSYNTAQHAIVIVSLSINAISAILLYLMIVVHFRLWLDAARVAFVFLFQLGSTITFALFGPSMPCNSLGSNCRMVQSLTVNLGWAQTGLLLLYAFYLGAMSYVPLPPPRANPEAALTDHKRSPSPTPSDSSETYLLKRSTEQRRSGGSVQSHSTFIQPLSSNPSLYGGSKASVRSVSVSSRQKYGVYRPVTPASFHSKVASSYSNTRVEDYIQASPHRPTPRQLPTSQSLPNPFSDFEPLYRHTSPASESFSVYSGLSGHSARPYTPATTHSSATLSYGLNGSQSSTPPPYLDKTWFGHPGFGQPATPRFPIPSGQLTVPPTPMSLRPSFQSNLPPREATASPGMQSVRSLSTSVHHFPSRGAVSSPTMSTRSLGLPATPRLMVLPPPPLAATMESMMNSSRS